MASPQAITVAKLGAAVTVSYASTYYLPAIVAKDIGVSLGITTTTVFLAFSFALLVSAGLGPFAGRMVDAIGGRTVLVGASVIFAQVSPCCHWQAAQCRYLLRGW